MSEDIVETLLNMMTEEQRTELINKLSKTDELRDVNKKQQETQPPQETRAPDDFTMKKDEPEQRSAEVEVKQRVNLFTDDGVEHKDDLNKTPDIRKRKAASKVKQKCQQCSREKDIHPAHRRETFICDDCLRSKVK